MTPSAGKNAVVNLLAKVLDGELHQRDAPSVKRDAPPADPTLYKRLAAVEARLRSSDHTDPYSAGGHAAEVQRAERSDAISWAAMRSGP
jgi:hypothetical protein